jgi:hypothetical protein
MLRLRGSRLATTAAPPYEPEPSQKLMPLSAAMAGACPLHARRRLDRLPERLRGGARA